jgi:hypothetical protein
MDIELAKSIQTVRDNWLQLRKLPTSNIEKIEILNQIKHIFKMTIPFEYTITSVAKMIGVCPAFACGVIRKDPELKNFRLRSQPIPDKLFIEPLTKEESWMLGYLAADGNNYHAKNSEEQRVSVSSTDNDIPIKFQKLTNIGYIKTRKRGKYKNCYSWARSNRELSQRLIKLGITPQKSFTVNFPQHLFNEHSVRGAIEGDGSVGIQIERNITPTCFVSFVSASREFIDNICAILNKVSGSKQKVRIGHGTWQITYTRRMALKIIYYLYDNSTEDCRMNRKHNNVMEIIKFYKEMDEKMAEKKESRKQFKKQIFNEYINGIPVKELSTKYNREISVIYGYINEFKNCII